MQVSKGVEKAIKVGIEKMVVDSWGIEQVSSNKESDPRIEARLIYQVSRSYQGGVEPAFQNNFLKLEKHKYECNPTHNSTNDPINIIISQNNLLI